jgi:hypothetical protein
LLISSSGESQTQRDREHGFRQPGFRRYRFRQFVDERALIARKEMSKSHSNLIRTVTRAGFAYPVRVGRIDKRGFDLISDAQPFGGMWYLKVADAIACAKHRSRSHNAVIRVYDQAGNVIETHMHAGDFKEW